MGQRTPVYQTQILGRPSAPLPWCVPSPWAQRAGSKLPRSRTLCSSGNSVSEGSGAIVLTHWPLCSDQTTHPVVCLVSLDLMSLRKSKSRSRGNEWGKSCCFCETPKGCLAFISSKCTNYSRNENVVPAMLPNGCVGCLARGSHEHKSTCTILSSISPNPTVSVWH